MATKKKLRFKVFIHFSSKNLSLTFSTSLCTLVIMILTYLHSRNSEPSCFSNVKYSNTKFCKMRSLLDFESSFKSFTH